MIAIIVIIKYFIIALQSSSQTSRTPPPRSFKRQSLPIANLSLLNIAMDIPKNLRQSELKKRSVLEFLHP